MSTALNLVIAFFMGNDIEGIMASPIGQPMAAVCMTIPYENYDLIEEIDPSQ